MKFDDFRRRADRVRELPLETVLALHNAVRDPRDRQKWHTQQGPVSITGRKFTNWHRNIGGGGAIDLVMHLAGLDVGAAVVWLEQHSSAGHAAAGIAAPLSSSSQRAALSVPSTSRAGPLRLPDRDGSKLRRVRNYLTQHRNLSSLVLDPLIDAGKLYADNRGNAVFLLVAGRDESPCRRRVTWNRNTCVAWHGAGHSKGLGLLLGRCERTETRRTLRIRHRCHQLFYALS